MANLISRTLYSIDPLPKSYASLLNHSAAQSFYLTLPWFQNFSATALDTGDQVRVYGIEDGTTGDALAALMTRRASGAKGSFKPRRVASLSNFYSSLFAPVVSRVADGVLGPLAETVCGDAMQWDVLELRPLERESPSFDELVDAFRAAGRIVQPFFCFGNWFLKTTGLSFKEYFRSLPSVLRNTVVRKTKKLEKTGRARLAILTGSDEAGIRAYEQVYNSSWKIPEPYPEFTSGLIRTAGQHGWLRLGIAYLDDKPIASQIWIVSAGKCTIFKLAYDENYSEYSAGSILTARLMEHVLEVDRVEEIDFGSGDDAYKKSWLPQRRERWGMMVFNPRSVRGFLMSVRHVGGHQAKSLLKRCLQSRGQVHVGAQSSRAPANNRIAGGEN